MTKFFNTFAKNKKTPFIVAEISGNHNQSLKKAKKLIIEIAKTGATAVKLQTFKPDTMTFNIKNKNFLIKNKKSIWKGSYLYELYKKAYTPWEWQKKLFMIANSYGLIAFSSAFDESSADFLKSINNPIFKISSFENTDLELIKYISKIKKPIILSAGLANISELNDAVKILKKNARNNFALLKCTSSYPADNVDLNLKTIQDMKKKFKCPVGFSDHTKDIYASIAAVSIGAEIIEKHVKLDDEKSIDSQFAIDTSDLKKLVDGCNKAYLSIGKKFYGPTNSEIGAYRRRRSLFYSKNLDKNTRLKKDHVSRKRPGMGLKIKFLNKIIGKKIKKRVNLGSPIKLSDFKIHI